MPVSPSTYCGPITSKCLYAAVSSRGVTASRALGSTTTSIAFPSLTTTPQAHRVGRRAGTLCEEPGPPARRSKGAGRSRAPFCSFGARRLRGGLGGDRHGNRVRYRAVLEERERRGRECHVRDRRGPHRVRARSRRRCGGGGR